MFTCNYYIMSDYKKEHVLDEFFNVRQVESLATTKIYF